MRARAEMAPSFIMSWHPGLDLELLAACREGTKVELAMTVEPRAAQASELASYARWDVYVLE